MNKENKEYFEIARSQGKYSEDTQWIVVHLLNVQERLNRISKTVSILLSIIIVLVFAMSIHL